MSPSHDSYPAAEVVVRRLRICPYYALVAAGALLLTVLTGLVTLQGAGVDIVANAAGIPKNAAGIGGFVNGAKALVDPALVMVAAIAPLALIAGGLVLLFGGRRGMQIIGTSLGVLLLLGSVTALIN